MGSIIENIKDVRGGSKSSTTKSDVKDISDEMIIHWNGPSLSECDSLIKQSLNYYFKGGDWHFKSKNIVDRFHKVSKVVSRIREEKSNFSFMAK